MLSSLMSTSTQQPESGTRPVKEWIHEEYLAAILSREVAARETSGPEIRGRATESRRGNYSKTVTSITSPA